MEFVVVGGVAMVLRGSSRVTVDLDVCYSRDVENLRRLAAALAPYRPRLRGAPPELPFQWDERTLASGLNFTLATDLGDV
ncbi:MAG: nucleotidyltransferase, partial [Betaproteobacteria bacterium]